MSFFSRYFSIRKTLAKFNEIEGFRRGKSVGVVEPTIAIIKGRIVIHFNKNVDEISLSKRQANILANRLKLKAKQTKYEINLD